MSKTSVKLLAATAPILAMMAFNPAPASASNPACGSGYTYSVQKIVSNLTRAKSCFNPSTDNFKFQDTYAGDGASGGIWYPNNSLSDTLDAWDTDGGDNGWEPVIDKTYAKNKSITFNSCVYDFSAEINYGCSTTGATT